MSSLIKVPRSKWVWCSPIIRRRTWTRYRCTLHVALATSTSWSATCQFRHSCGKTVTFFFIYGIFFFWFWFRFSIKFCFIFSYWVFFFILNNVYVASVNNTIGGFVWSHDAGVPRESTIKKEKNTTCTWVYFFFLLILIFGLFFSYWLFKKYSTSKYIIRCMPL